MGEIAHSLDLNWSLIVTQIIGFLLTVWILKAFAWEPLLKMLEDRRNKIAGDIDDAEKIKADAERLLDDYNAKLRDIEAEARSKIQDAVTEGNRIASEIRENAREEARKIVEKSREELSRDIAKARVQLRDEMVSMAVRGAEKIIAAKLDEAEHKRLLEDFLKEVEQSE
jgi:F-type H+-transporting ATPase subunit b